MADVASGPILDSTPHYANLKKKILKITVALCPLKGSHV
jgi:hypothetical protein